MRRIAGTFESLRSRKQTAFMPFLAAGDPDMSTTVELIRLLAGCGVDLIEIGFPYSDPIADGPVIQEAYTRALAKKIGVADIFGALRRSRARRYRRSWQWSLTPLFTARAPKSSRRRQCERAFPG